MRKRFILLFAALWCVAAGVGEPAKPVGIDPGADWKQEVKGKESKTLHTTDGGKHWVDVSPAAMTLAVQQQDLQGDDFLLGYVELDPLDAQRAWLAFQPPGWDDRVILEYTGDGGQHWRQTTAPVASDDIQISFLDEKHGFLMAMGGPGMGPHEKKVYGTEDGGKRWFVLGSPPGPNFLAGGITFRNLKEGWITGTYRGDDFFPLYRTVDGGKTWKLQKFPVPKGYTSSYGDTEPPVFSSADKKHGILPVHLGGMKTSLNFETDDGGATWHLPPDFSQWKPESD